MGGCGRLGFRSIVIAADMLVLLLILDVAGWVNDGREMPRSRIHSASR
jgi:hypothetical protein